MQSGRAHRLHAAVVGYGSYGRLHAQKYLEHPGVDLTAIVDPDAARRRAACNELPGIAAFDRASLLDRPVDIASVVSPASTHYAVARELLDRGIHLLVEKPFTTSPRQALELLALAKQRRLVLQPGHIERFDATLAAMSARLPDPRYVEARRLTRWRERGGDTDVVLDLMIHDIDYVLRLVASPVAGVRAHGTRVFSGRWDVCNAQLRFANGCIANLTASRAGPEPERRLHVFAANACMLADGRNESILLHERSGAKPTIGTRCCDWRHDDSLAREIDGFVQAVACDRPPKVSAEDGWRAVEIASLIVQAMEDDAGLFERISAPLTDSARAIAWLRQRV